MRAQALRRELRAQALRRELRAQALRNIGGKNMLLTISLKGKNTQDLGYLLHKNPYRAQCFDLNFGKVYVFYPEVGDEKTTAALLLDINPVDLARGKVGSEKDGLFDYVNDRPYVCSSFMSTAIVRVFGTAVSGKCAKRQELADSKLDLEASISMLPCMGDIEFVKEIFEPLGYEVYTKSYVLDECFPEWGQSPYINLTIKGKVKLSELLNHLYVLIPMFDRQKHYYVGSDEIEKLIKHGEGWLSTHPCRNKIIRRYFSVCKSYANEAIKIISENELQYEAEQNTDFEKADENTESKKPLNKRRLDTVLEKILESGSDRVIDMGCGDGKLTKMLLDEKSISKIAAFDVSVQALKRTAERLRLDTLSDVKRKKVDLFLSSLMYLDDRFKGYDCACIIEVIEHLDLNRLKTFENVVFGYAMPKTVIVTTPNVEYNKYYGISEEQLRHNDHRFEWTRNEFDNWCRNVCGKFGYTVKTDGIGDFNESFGSPTQIGVFTKCV